MLTDATSARPWHVPCGPAPGTVSHARGSFGGGFATPGDDEQGIARGHEGAEGQLVNVHYVD